ncbi:UvrD-helicase domain-containing protein [Desulfosudis oleivorans]|uniref:DNA 3'-5' helicase n=1 Tax=Desulfosudis oleivorans (strain DSM 6200 / JCM 39069 / Hxd3) TaxID=96561 RepID=A8ZXL9_DESOH|nr:UvrD-helicase domain-containing protein [Desulfosudis oleivorans]ABW66977.1 UvrD/REP helicase [Desulfosudis oleivorans Hxd3]
MRYIADLHIHSAYSRATSSDLDFEHLYIWAQIKGITVLATGDYTHPAWFAQISEKLVPAEPGLFRLKDDLAKVCDAEVPAACRRPVRFVLSTEISNIYKKAGAVRKNHNLVFMPGLKAAARFNAKLGAIGNIQSDGRPILGMDARNLLETALEVSSDAFFVPAHVWTPWFSLFGSRSGFDAIEACFEDLTDQVFALETGLSSDPPMNWRVSGIDGRTLISNSDAHSPANLGREANLFDTELSYGAMIDAMKTGDPDRFLGTYEFFPEEGKYHLDGHRDCGIRLHPAQTRQHQGLCPVCGKPLTLGVLYRVEELADRDEGSLPAKSHPFYSIIPLPEIISELVGVGPKSKKVVQAYRSVLERLGPEFDILYRLPAEEIVQSGLPLLDVAVSRMREGKVTRSAGYDGAYGRVTLFSDGEIERLKGEQHLFAVPNAPAPAKQVPLVAAPRQASLFEAPDVVPAPVVAEPENITAGLSTAQLAAVNHGAGPMVIVAGPGSGKTRTITCRMAHLIQARQVPAGAVLAITFTNRAAREMADRLAAMLGGNTDLPFVSTFHGFCLGLLREQGGFDAVVLDEYDRRILAKTVLKRAAAGKADGLPGPDRLLDMIASAKQAMLGPGDDLSGVARETAPDLLATLYGDYQALLAENSGCDYEDLICRAVDLLEGHKDVRQTAQQRFVYIFVDEYQDVNHAQYRLIQALAPAGGNICVIGDPDQAIYGFRGASAAYFQTFETDYPGAARFFLEKNYRSTQTIVSAAYHVITGQDDDPGRVRVYSDIAGVPVVTVARLASERAEAVFAGRTIERMVGGLGFHSVDFGKAGYEAPAGLGFADFAVLCRTRRQTEVFADVLESAGIPCHVVSKQRIYAARGVGEAISLLRLAEGQATFIDLEKAGGVLYGATAAKKQAVISAWAKERNLPAAEVLAATERFPVPGLSQAAQRRLAGAARTVAELKARTGHLPVAGRLRFLIENMEPLATLVNGSKKNREAFDAAVEAARPAGTDATAFFDTVALAADADAVMPGVDRVRLMTLHAAKGLEFAVVFVAGCEEDLVPFSGYGDRATDIDEERRLFYVAMTRAKERLFLTWAKNRTLYGKRKACTLSRFVADIEGDLKEQAEVETGRPPKDGHVQMELF